MVTANTDTDVTDAVDTDETTPEQPSNLIKKKDIYDHVTVTTGLRRREVREAVDATFGYLFECVSAGKDVQMPPLGKIRVITKGEGENQKTLYRLNLQKPGKGGGGGGTAEAEAEPSEE